MAYNAVEKRTWKELAPGIRARTFWGDKMMVCHVHLDNGATIPLHSHPHEQGGTVIEGEIAFTIAGEQKTLTAGDSYVIKRDVPHTATAKTACKLFEIFAPVREEYK